MYSYSDRIFACFAAEDRYMIAEPIVYHLKNYGINIWYDRQALLLSDNRREKNLDDGARKSMYAIVIISKHTADSICTMEELTIIEERYHKGNVIVFPILYEITPDEIPSKLQWIKELIFKEVDRHSGTREICNHIACKITNDLLNKGRCKNILDVINISSIKLPIVLHELLKSYQGIDNENLNSRVSLLYASYLVISVKLTNLNPTTHMISKIFERLYSETRLNLDIDYRELWLLENSICILVNYYMDYCIESSI